MGVDLREYINRLADKVKYLRYSLPTEEATKNALILPVISAWGYDVSNPKEVLPEMTCDISGRNDKVDYAIFRNGTPIIIIECKQIEKRLDTFVGQLSKYYVATTAKFAVLTNGDYWLFYSDFERQNLMDSIPFFVFSLSRYTDADVACLERFSKSCFDKFSIARDFGEMYYSYKVRSYLKECIRPSEKFVKFIADGAGVSDLQLCRNTIVEEMGGTKENDGLSQEERNIVNAVQRSVSDLIDSSVLKPVRRGSYLLLCKYGNIYRWVARIKVGKTNKIGFPIEAYRDCKWYNFNNTDDIIKMKDMIVQAVDLASFEGSRQQLQKGEKPQIHRK